LPELPETETMARQLDAAVSGRTIERVTVTKPDVIREVSAPRFKKLLTGAKFLRSWRRAKLVISDLDTGNRILMQPRFTGGWTIDDGKLDASALKYSTLAFFLDDGRAIHYCDTRRLGTVAVMDEKRFQEYTGALGIEPLDRSFTAAHLSSVFQSTHQAVKRALMDQKKIVGVGNIYANEALWAARIDPSRDASTLTDDELKDLHRSVVTILREAIKMRGTSFRDYRDTSGERGGFVDRLNAYGREGLPCPRCKSKMVGTHEIDGRQTVLCIRCQK
jgi:formamidopyrimidine-DNA glycosylase